MHKNILVTILCYLLLLQSQYTVIQISNQVPPLGVLKLSGHWDVYGLLMAEWDWQCWPLTGSGSLKYLLLPRLSTVIVKWPNAAGASLGVWIVKLSWLFEFKVANVISVPHAMKKKELFLFYPKSCEQ